MCDITKLKLHRRCKTPIEGVAVLVRKDGIDVPICYSCWKRIGNGDWEIGIYPKLTIEEIFGRRIKEEQEATFTEYHLKDSKKLTVQNEEKDKDLEWSE